MRAVLVDAGPLVALIDRGDRHHVACRAAILAQTAPLLTTWPAVTEAMYLLGAPAAQDALAGLLEAEAIALAPLGTGDLPGIRALMAKYGSQPMDLADATLVRVAERDHLDTIVTFDRRDFEVYRIGRRGRFTVLP